VLLRLTFIFAFIVCSFTYSFSQVTDSVTAAARKDSILKKHSPKKAALMSACLPGLGQVYNKKYWKVPVIYVGLAALGYAFYQSQTSYAHYRDAYKYRVDKGPLSGDQYPYVSNSTLFDVQQHYHRNRDLAAIGLGLLYMLNIVDASVDGHLFAFDVSDNLTLNIHPGVLYIASTNHYQTALTLKINF